MIFYFVAASLEASAGCTILEESTVTPSTESAAGISVFSTITESSTTVVGSPDLGSCLHDNAVKEIATKANNAIFSSDFNLFYNYFFSVVVFVSTFTGCSFTTVESVITTESFPIESIFIESSIVVMVSFFISVSVFVSFDPNKLQEDKPKAVPNTPNTITFNANFFITLIFLNVFN
ncbi:hypothetical protein AS589_02255 [Empedobacter brevis]|uniref:hypothetical protein n=1 Tax=Empedobacter brevis TaxID=247 RepID=UPI001320095B|nr:hypothetical protein [Empedobacter brevis]QHC83693.1 hypothetical protein AS589_02255 [Empedobacter brevis]